MRRNRTRAEGRAMGDVIQLNRHRKKRARLARARAAAENRARQGRGKQETEAARRQRERDAMRLDARRLEDGTDRESGPKQR